MIWWLLVCTSGWYATCLTFAVVTTTPPPTVTHTLSVLTELSGFTLCCLRLTQYGNVAGTTDLCWRSSFPSCESILPSWMLSATWPFYCRMSQFVTSTRSSGVHSPPALTETIICVPRPGWRLWRMLVGSVTSCRRMLFHATLVGNQWKEAP